MKKSNLMVFIMFLLVACQQSDTSWRQLIDPNDTSRITFDIVNFDRNATEGYKSKRWQYEDSNGVKIKQYTISYGYFESREYPDSLYADLYWFYPSGVLKQKGKKFNNSFGIGVFYDYAENGTITFAEDTDAPFTYTLDSVLVYMEAQGATSVKQSKLTSINRFVVESDDCNPLEIDGKVIECAELEYFPYKGYVGPVWRLEWIIRDKNSPHFGDYRVVGLSGTTGKVLVDTIRLYEE